MKLTNMAPMTVILFVMSVGLVRSDDNVAMESTVHYQTAYKVHPDENEAQSFEKSIRDSQPASQNHYYIAPPKFPYSNGVEGQHNQHDLHQHSVPDNSGHVTITSNQDSQSLHGNHVHQEYANVPQALYLHQYPVQQEQVYGSQPSHHYQVEKDEHGGKIVGFSSFVEHFTPKDDDEELQSALKEGSMKDIKRLVPKSGISFKIYQDGKDWESNSENQKTEIRSHFQNYLTQNHVKPEPIVKSHRGQGKFRIEVPATQIKSHEFRQTATHLEEPKQIYLSQTSESTPQQHHIQTPVTQFSHEPQQLQQAHLIQEYHYTKPEESSQRQSLDVASKGSPGLESNFQIRVKEDNFNQGQYGASWNSPPAKVEVLHSKAHYQQNNWKSAEAPNKPEALSDSVKQVNVDPTAHEQFQQLRSYADIVIGKTIQNNFDHQKALEGSTSFDIKNAIGSANSLDHETQQTSTEIHNKAASQVTANEYHSNLGKPTLAYGVPNIQVQPTASLLIGNNAHGASLQQEYHTKYAKDAVSLTSELPRPVVSSPSIHDINGKYFSQPQSVQIWSSGHYGQGNTLTSNHLHQSLVALPAVKDQEILQHIKTSTPQASVAILPTSLHHHQQQQQPHQPRAIGFYRDVSLTKFPQDIQFQYKKAPTFQVPHIRPVQLVSATNPELSLYKTKLPSINLNTVVMKPDLSQLFKESSGKKIIPILVKKRKNRSNKEVTGVVYGQTTTATNRGAVKAKLRQDKTIRVNYLPESSQNINHYLPKNGDNNEFSVSASYKVDRSLTSQRD